MLITPNHVYAGENKIDLTKDTNTVYTHPTAKQCNYSYTHPTTKQCNYAPNLSGYATKSDLASVRSPLRLLATYTDSAQMTPFDDETYILYILNISFALPKIPAAQVLIKDRYGELGLGAIGQEDSYTLYISRTASSKFRAMYLSGTTINTVYRLLDASVLGLRLYVDSAISFIARLYGLP